MLPTGLIYGVIAIAGGVDTYVVGFGLQIHTSGCVVDTLDYIVWSYGRWWVIWVLVVVVVIGGGGGGSYGWWWRGEVMWVVGGSGVWAAVSGDERSEKEATPHKPRTSKAFLQSAAALPCFGL